MESVIIYLSLQALDHLLLFGELILWFLFPWNINKQRSEFQVNFKRTSLVEGKGWSWRRAAGKKKSALPQSCKISTRVGLDPQCGPPQEKGTISSPCQDFPQKSTKLDSGTRSKQKQCPESRVKVRIWFSELRRNLAQELEFIGPFHGFNGVTSFESYPAQIRFVWYILCIYIYIYVYFNRLAPVSRRPGPHASQQVV